MALQSDDFGFLVGKPVEWGKALSLWSDIREDVAAIRTSLSKGAASAKFSPSQSNAANDRIMNRASAPVIKLKADAQAATLQKLLASNPSVSDMKGQFRPYKPSVSTAERLRDSKGRFTSGGQSTKKKPNEKTEEGGTSSGRSLNLGSNIGNAINEAPDVDPLIAASKELRDIVSPIGRIVSPIGRGFGKLFGKKKDDATKDEGKKSRVWFRRIWRSLETSRKENRDSSKLKKLGNRSGAAIGVGGAGGGIFSAIGGLLENIPFIGNLFGGKGKGLLGGLLGGAKNLFKGGLKKVPILGTLLTLFGAGSDAIDTENDAGLTRQEKNDKHVVNGAQTVGGLAGAGIGFLLGGPIGAIIGNIVGEIAGKYIGGWINDFRHSDLAQSLLKAWDSAIGAIPEIWNSVVSGVSSAFDGAVKFITDAFSKVTSAVIDAVTAFFAKYGIDLPKAYKDIKEAVVTKAEETKEATVKFAEETYDKAENFAKKTYAAVAPVVEKATDVAGEALDKAVALGTEGMNNAKEISARWAAAGKKEIAETSVGKAVSYGVDAVKGVFGGGSKGRKALFINEMIKAGITDPTEQAMFLAQVDNETGGFENIKNESFNYKDKEDFVKKYGRRLGISNVSQAQEILNKGEEFTANSIYGNAYKKDNYKAKDLGNTEEGDGYKFRGRGYIQLTGRSNYARAGKALGLDLENNPDLAFDPANAAKIATYYWKNRKGLDENKNLISLRDAAKAGDVDTTTKLVNGGDHGLKNRRKLFGEYLGEVKSGSIDEINKNTEAKIAAISAQNFTASAPVNFKLPNKIPDPPQPQSEIIPLGGANPQPITVTFDKRDVGQDLIDRNIAHVVTGGMSGGHMP